MENIISENCNQTTSQQEFCIGISFTIRETTVIKISTSVSHEPLCGFCFRPIIQFAEEKPRQFWTRPLLKEEGTFNTRHPFWDTQLTWTGWTGAGIAGGP